VLKRDLSKTVHQYIIEIGAIDRTYNNSKFTNQSINQPTNQSIYQSVSQTD